MVEVPEEPAVKAIDSEALPAVIELMTGGPGRASTTALMLIAKLCDEENSPSDAVKV